MYRDPQTREQRACHCSCWGLTFSMSWCSFPRASVFRLKGLTSVGGGMSWGWNSLQHNTVHAEASVSDSC